MKVVLSRCISQHFSRVTCLQMGIRSEAIEAGVVLFALHELVHVGLAERDVIGGLLEARQEGLVE